MLTDSFVEQEQELANSLYVVVGCTAWVVDISWVWAVQNVDESLAAQGMMLVRVIRLSDSLHLPDTMVAVHNQVLEASMTVVAEPHTAMQTTMYAGGTEGQVDDKACKLAVVSGTAQERAVWAGVTLGTVVSSILLLVPADMAAFDGLVQNDGALETGSTEEMVSVCTRH